MTKPREYWIDPGKRSIFPQEEKSETVRVIEYSAYEVVLKEVERLKQLNLELELKLAAYAGNS